MIANPVTERTALVLAGPSDTADLELLVGGLGYLPLHAESLDDIIEMSGQVALCLVDLRQHATALRIARAVRTHHPEAIVLGIADPDRPNLSAEAIRAGVFDVLPRPVSSRDLEALVANAREQALLAGAGGHRASDGPARGIVAASPAMRQMMELVERAATGRCGILI